MTVEFTSLLELLAAILDEQAAIDDFTANRWRKGRVLPPLRINKEQQIGYMSQCVGQGAPASIQGGMKRRVHIEERLRGCENIIQPSNSVSRSQIHATYGRMVEGAIDDFLASHGDQR